MGKNKNKNKNNHAKSNNATVPDTQTSGVNEPNTSNAASILFPGPVTGFENNFEPIDDANTNDESPFGLNTYFGSAIGNTARSNACIFGTGPNFANAPMNGGSFENMDGLRRTLPDDSLGEYNAKDNQGQSSSTPVSVIGAASGSVQERDLAAGLNRNVHPADIESDASSGVDSDAEVDEALDLASRNAARENSRRSVAGPRASDVGHQDRDGLDGIQNRAPQQPVRERLRPREQVRFEDLDLANRDQNGLGGNESRAPRVSDLGHQVGVGLDGNQNRVPQDSERERHLPREQVRFENQDLAFQNRNGFENQNRVPRQREREPRYPRRQVRSEETDLAHQHQDELDGTQNWAPEQREREPRYLRTQVHFEEPDLAHQGQNGLAGNESRAPRASGLGHQDQTGLDGNQNGVPQPVRQSLRPREPVRYEDPYLPDQDRNVSNGAQDWASQQPERERCRTREPPAHVEDSSLDPQYWEDLGWDVGRGTDERINRPLHENRKQNQDHYHYQDQDDDDLDWEVGPEAYECLDHLDQLPPRLRAQEPLPRGLGNDFQPYAIRAGGGRHPLAPPHGGGIIRYPINENNRNQGMGRNGIGGLPPINWNPPNIAPFRPQRPHSPRGFPQQNSQQQGFQQQGPPPQSPQQGFQQPQQAPQQQSPIVPPPPGFRQPLAGRGLLQAQLGPYRGASYLQGLPQQISPADLNPANGAHHRVNRLLSASNQRPGPPSPPPQLSPVLGGGGGRYGDRKRPGAMDPRLYNQQALPSPRLSPGFGGGRRHGGGGAYRKRPCAMDPMFYGRVR